MGGEHFTILLRGFKLSYAAFDEFLAAHDLSTREGGNYIAPDEVAIYAALFRSTGAGCDVKILIPSARGFDGSKFVYVCCDWVPVLAIRNIDESLQNPVPPGFEALPQLLGTDAKIARYVMNCATFDTTLRNEWLEERMLPKHCDVCDMELQDRYVWVKHRHDDHGIHEETNPLPEC
ncbi:hypothetical protein B0J11DRAFT_528628 [Dendryphion nanum]|uniref:C2H2-type domain-containing protein n=1 Tax=Dendryphion nanum TaxID=256645 RepID=A0A9P9IM46_9PLEO|nr:hypothetical protein B0J11DRAFT_528628 [Dendryphion nanum]